MLFGIDEAGRGSALGSLVVCGFGLPAARLPELEALGLKDSKQLTPARRGELAASLRRLPGAVRLVRRLRPRQVDAAVGNGGLNAAEMRAFVWLIRRGLCRVPPEAGRQTVVYLDALTSRPERFGRNVGALVPDLPIRIVAENRADTKYAVVQAAAILAKVTRDAELARLGARWGILGSGYPSDPLTRAYLVRALRAAAGSARVLPPFIRRSWRTLETLAGTAAALPIS
jgi:ribonuclease HII